MLQLKEKSNPFQWKEDLIGLKTPRYVFESFFFKDIQDSNISKNFTPKSHSYLLFGAAGNGKTFFINNIFTMTHCQTKIVECWELKEAFNFDTQLFSFENRKIILYLKDIDAIFMHSEESQIRQSFTHFMLNYSSNTYVIADTNKVTSLNNSMIDIFDHRIYFNFPSNEDRIKMLKFHFPINISNKSLDLFLELTNGYTFSDIVILIKDAKMRPILQLIQNDNINADDCTCSEDDLLQSLHSLQPSYSESDRNHFLSKAQDFGFIINSRNETI